MFMLCLTTVGLSKTAKIEILYSSIILCLNLDFTGHVISVVIPQRHLAVSKLVSSGF